MKNPDILIASSSLDPSWVPVAEKLDQRGYDVLVYEADKVADGAVALNVRVEAGAVEINYNQRRLCLDGIAAAWLRRPNSFSADLPDKARQMSLDRERTTIQNNLWDIVPDERWLNAPRHIRDANPKLRQLVIAADLGFHVPDTVITNRWDTILHSLPEHVIHKSVGPPTLLIDNKRLLVFARPYKNTAAELPTAINPFPGMWQSRVTKEREWRVTVIGDDLFAAQVLTDPQAKDDWRKHQGDPGLVSFVAADFPEAEKQRCFAYLAAFGLKYGAFDFIESPDGKLTFLECNPNGQYGWLEDALGFPMSDALTDELIKIAQASQQV